MTQGLLIAGEWGSVVMRLYLCTEAEGVVEVLATTTGPGVVGCDDLEAAFFEAAGPWFQAHGALPVILAGMIGSNIGWRDSGYVDAPAGIADLAKRLTHIQARGVDIHFSPGLKCSNLFGLPDLVRGEEMQVLGWLAAAGEVEHGLVCLPGRHVKWVLTDAGRITSFTTGMHGEIHDLLLAHGLLGKGVALDAWSDSAFDAGLDAIFADETLSLGHALFATRSRLVLGEHAADEAAAFLSGLTIGADVRDWLHALDANGSTRREVTVLAHDIAGERYVRALNHFSVSTRTLHRPFLAAQGLTRVLNSAYPTGRPANIAANASI